MKPWNYYLSGNIAFILIFWLSSVFLQAQTYFPFALEELDTDPMMRLSFYGILDSAEWRAANNISECRINEYKFKKEVVSEEVTGTALYKFDAGGYPAESEFNNGKYKLKSLLDKDNRISRGIVFKEGNDTILIKSFDYDSLGRVCHLGIEKKGFKTYIYNIGSIHWFYMTNGCSFTFGYNQDNKVNRIMGYTHLLFSESSNPFYTEEIIYNDQGKISENNICLRVVSAIDELMSHGFTEAECSYKIEQLYDINGSIMRSNYYYPDMGIAGPVANDKPQGFYLWKTNEKGQTTEAHHFDANSKLQSKTNYLYDDKGNLLQVTINDTYGKITSRITQAYNANNQITMDLSYGSENEIKYMYSYKYDSNGIKTEVTKYSTDTRKPHRLYRITYK